MVKVFSEGYGEKIYVKILGHASDRRVCAGVSALFYAAVAEFGAQGRLIESRAIPGESYFSLRRYGGYDGAFEMFRKGIECLESEFPKMVSGRFL